MFEEWVDARTGLTVWVSAGSGEARILPDVAADVMLWRESFYLAGYDSTAQYFDRGRGSTTLGVRLPPGTLAALAGDSASTVLNQRVALERAPEELALRAQHDPSAAAAELATWTSRRLARVQPDRNSCSSASAVLSGVRNGERAGVTARRLGWSERKLHRFTVEHFGIPPVRLRSLTRFRFASTLIARGASLADAAARAGYSDQPHFTRSVREIAGTTPGLLHAPHRDTASRRSA